MWQHKQQTERVTKLNMQCLIKDANWHAQTVWTKLFKQTLAALNFFYLEVLLMGSAEAHFHFCASIPESILIFTHTSNDRLHNPVSKKITMPSVLFFWELYCSCFS